MDVGCQLNNEYSKHQADKNTLIHQAETNTLNIRLICYYVVFLLALLTALGIYRLMRF